VIIVDVNLLLYAVITGFTQHEPARSWWEDALNGAENVGLAMPTIFGFLRVGTNPRALTKPLTVDAATSYVEAWLRQPLVEALVPGPRHLEIAFGLLRDVEAARDLTTDAQLAALAIEHDGVVYSNDTDFARFDGVRWVNPLRPAKS
jgi:toxin-antitoxin system PIN domain toxin